MSRFRKVRVLKIDPQNPEKEAIAIAAELLRDGGLVAFATETVYGLGANLLDKNAVDRLYDVKDRPKNIPFTIHVSNLKLLQKMVVNISPIAKKLINRFWPGPLTIIMNDKDGKKTGFRMPSNRVALDLIEKARVPVIVPSANISGEEPPTSADKVLEGLDNKIDMILDCGQTRIGIESTVIDTSVFPCKVLREGAIPRSTIKDAW